MKNMLKKLDALKSNQKVNLVLGGGALKGVAHIPLLEYLEDRKIEINAISGTSAGSLVGALYASGNSPKEILDFFMEMPLFKYAWLTPFANGMFNSIKYQKYFNGKIKTTFEELDIKLYACATNMQKSKPVYFNEGELWNRILASCAVPGIFKPVEINDELYSDGAVMDNYPIEPFKNEDLPLIGSFLRATADVGKHQLSSKRKVIKRSVLLQRLQIEREKLLIPDVSIIHDLNSFSAFKKKDITKIYQQSKTLFTR